MIITLLALTLAVGIVIDDAIVVLENAIRFLQERDPDPRTATLAATKDVGLAVLATTLSLCAGYYQNLPREPAWCRECESQVGGASNIMDSLPTPATGACIGPLVSVCPGD